MRRLMLSVVATIVFAVTPSVVLAQGLSPVFRESYIDAFIAVPFSGEDRFEGDCYIDFWGDSLHGKLVRAVVDVQYPDGMGGFDWHQVDVESWTYNKNHEAITRTMEFIIYEEDDWYNENGEYTLYVYFQYFNTTTLQWFDCGGADDFTVNLN